MPEGWIGAASQVIDGLSYLLRATFDAADQGYADAQVLDTVAEGVQDGQLTVVEVDGTLAISSNECAFTAQSTPAWGDLGFYSQAITRALGRGLLETVNKDANDVRGGTIQWNDNGGLAITDWIYVLHPSNGGEVKALVYDGAGNVLENIDTVAYSASTDYQLAIILGGYDVNSTPFYAGQNKADYTYGAWFLAKGSGIGDGTSWTLLWTTSQGGP